MSTGMESPQSISITGYYKGFSVVVTKRETDAEINPLIDDAVEAIDYLIEKGFLPSWNSETNKSFVAPVQTTITREPVDQSPPATARMCRMHEAPMYSAISKKTDKPYWSHDSSEGKKCFGRGYPEDLERERYQSK